jgi:hypothetical protein
LNVVFNFDFDDNRNLFPWIVLCSNYKKSLTFGKRVFQAAKQKSYLASLISERLYLAKLQVREERSRQSAADQQKISEGGIDEFSHITSIARKLPRRGSMRSLSAQACYVSLKRR